MQKRAYGLEREYSFYPLKVLEDGWGMAEFLKRATKKLLPHFRAGEIITPRDSEFIVNQGRYYWDTGTHFETATPECKSGRDLVIWDSAGERILEDIAIALNAGVFFKLAPSIREKIARLGGCTFFKSNVAPNEQLDLPDDLLKKIQSRVLINRYVSCGSHLNFQFNINEAGCSLYDGYGILAPFLFTSAWMSGSGAVYEQDGGRLAYALSQRAPFTACLANKASTSLRPMFMNRDKHLADSNKYRRLQIVGLDSALCEWQTYVPAVILGIMLRMIEDRVVRVDDYNAFGDTVRFSEELLSAQNRLLWFGEERCAFPFRGETHTAASLHRKYYLDPICAYKASGVSWSKEEEDGLQKYGFLIDALDRASSSFELAEILAPYIGWAAKLHHILLPAFDRLGCSMKRGNPSDPSDGSFEIAVGETTSRARTQHKIELLDARFHDVRQDVGLYYALEKKGLVRRISSEAEVVRAKEYPPSGTRAEARDRRIAQLRAQGNTVTLVSWACLQYQTIDFNSMHEYGVEPTDADPASFVPASFVSSPRIL